MNVIDDFFSIGTWREVARALEHRRWEVLQQPARAALKSRLQVFEASSTVTCLINAYWRGLDKFALGDRLGVMKDTSALPKLTDADLTRLAQVRDAPSARQFMDASREMALRLICCQVLHGADFWRLLLASAERMSGATEAAGSPAGRTTICVEENGVTRKLCKILPLKDGGFAVTAPYHQAREGFLMKMPRVRDVGVVDIPISTIIPYVASDRVKLSYHADGFVQYSGEDSSKITSGKDPLTGQPRGLGLFACPLDEPVRSGPSVGCSAWGLDDFEAWKPRRGEYAVIFATTADFYEEPEDEPTPGETRQAGVGVSMFPIPSRFVDEAIGNWDTGDRITLVIPMNISNRMNSLPVRLVRSGPDCALAVIANRLHFDFPAVSGFQLCSPSDATHGMVAIYPSPDKSANAASLDYKPQSDRA